MQTEIEAKFLDVDHDEIRAKLKGLSAVCEQPMRTMVRNNFDYPDLRLEKVGGWIRVRDEGDKITMAEYDVTEAEVDAWPEIKFVSVPDWLKKLKK